MKKTIISILILALLISIFIYNVFAVDIKTRLDIVQKASETKNLDDNQGTIQKSIISSNQETGEVNLKVTVNNISTKSNSDGQIYENTEVFIIVPEYTDAAENENLTYVETLASKVLGQNSKTKIGVIGIQGPIRDNYIDNEGRLVQNENDQSAVNGTANDAECIVNLTDNIDVFKNSLRNMNSEKKEYYSNLQAALRLARNSFSNKVNKILISIYDRAPSTAIGLSSQGYSYGGWFSQYSTAEEAIRAKLDDLVSYTKSEILLLKDSNIDFILLRPDDTEFDQKWYSTSTGELSVEIDGKPYADNLYGTLEKPTYGKMYSLNNDNLEEIVTEYIYSDVMEKIQPSMTNVTIDDYFPKEIIDNFDIEIKNSDTMQIDTTKLLTDNYITYNVGNIEGNSSSSLEYTLKIKDMKNEDLLNKTIATNEKVELKYTDYLGNEKNVTLSSSPKIQLTEVKEELTATVSYDPSSNTTGKVTATIKTNKKVKKVKGWTLSDDGMVLTKKYSKNTTEKVHLEAEDGTTKNVTIKVKNIGKSSSSKKNSDSTLSKKTIPYTGSKQNILVGVAILVIIALILYERNKTYKDIK